MRGALHLAIAALLFSPIARAVAQTAAAPQAAITVPADANYANESTDWGVPAQKTPGSPVGSRTPTTIPGGTVLTTRQVADMIQRNAKMILIDALDNPGHATIPGAHRVWFAGRPEWNNDFNVALRLILARFTGNDANYPIVFFCGSSECWESYNAALRAIAFGFKNVYWYRGGTVAWAEAKMPMSSDYGFEQRYIP